MLSTPLSYSAKSVAILGGQSALASAIFHERLVHRIRALGAMYDDQFPQFLHFSKSIPGLNFEGLLTKEPHKALLGITSVLQQINPAIMVAPCGSLTLIIDELMYSGALQKSIFTPVHAINKLSLLGDSMVFGAGYTHSHSLVTLEKGSVLYPTDHLQNQLLDLIKSVRTEGPTTLGTATLFDLIGQGCAAGGKQVILACTELSVLLQDTEEVIQSLAPDILFVDGMAVLLNETVASLNKT